MPDYRHIYATQGAAYDRLVSREDYQRRLLPTLEAIRPLDNLQVVELGAGTGRLTRLLLPRVRSILACDGSPHMLVVAAASLRRPGRGHCLPAVADNARIPAASSGADLVIAGWSLGHACGWYPGRWPQVVAATLAEMRRLLRPGGTAVILETLGAGQTDPRPPTTALADYYRFLEQDHGYSATWLRTDYRFDSQAEADTLLTFFFGPEMAGRVDPVTLLLPECTGIWWRHVPGPAGRSPLAAALPPGIIRP